MSTMPLAWCNCAYVLYGRLRFAAVMPISTSIPVQQCAVAGSRVAGLEIPSCA